MEIRENGMLTLRIAEVLTLFVIIKETKPDSKLNKLF